MVQATVSRVRNNATPSRGTQCVSGGYACLTPGACDRRDNGECNRQESFQVSLVPGDDVIQPITAAAFHPALGHTVLPGTLDQGLQAGDLQ
jgi:hypothetical protein